MINDNSIKKILKIDINQKYMTCLLEMKDGNLLMLFEPISILDIMVEKSQEFINNLKLKMPIEKELTCNITVKALKDNSDYFHLIPLDEKKEYLTVIKILNALYDI